MLYIVTVVLACSTINKILIDKVCIYIDGRTFSLSVCLLVTRPLRGLAVKALRGMPPTLFNRPVQFTNRIISKCLEHAGDRQISQESVEIRVCVYYAAKRFYNEAAKRPS